MILPVSVNHIQDSCLLILTKISMTAFVARFTPYQDVRAVAEDCGDATVRGANTYDAKQVFSV